MRILHLIDTTGPGGAETIFIRLAARSAADAPVLTSIRGYGWVFDELTRQGLAPLLLDCKGSFNLRFLYELSRVVRQHQVDLIHSHLLGSNVYASLAGLLTRTPVISTFHGSVDISSTERFAALKFEIVKRCSTIVTVSDELRSQLARRFKLSESEIRLIPNAIDCQAFQNRDPMPLRAQYGIPRDMPLVGSLGNIRPAKDYANALRAIGHLRDAGIDAALVVAGHQKEPLYSELRGLRAKLGLKDRVFFHGFVESPAEFLAGLDIFLLSSSSEGHPLALTQAMAARVPIVATRCGVERIVSEDNAWLADKESPEALAQALTSALRNPEESRQRAVAAHELAIAKYDFEPMYQQYHQIYRRLTSS